MLWLNVSIVRKILGILGVCKSHSSMAVNDAIEIAQDYGGIMLHKSPAPFYISDVNKLPHPKDSIKQALMVILRTNGKQQVMDALKIGYLQLANWQEGVGETDLALGMVDNAINGVDSVRGATIHPDEVDRWNDVLEEERIMLKDDLVSIGVW